MKTEWDYTERAHTYDNRADYSSKAIEHLLKQIGSSPDKPVADIGAGTGKLTKILLNNGLMVKAVEPNDNMRHYGIQNTKDQNVVWSEGTGEQTGLEKCSVQAALFGSSFNVVDQQKTLNEVARVLMPNGWFCCMWNHRDVEDLTQKGIEKLIRSFIPQYDYGLRRQDPTPVIEENEYFSKVFKIEECFSVLMKKNEIISAWRSHDTLFRQSDGKFETIISSISDLLAADEYVVPYYTRIWVSQAISG
jgi:ubiquinone/menaquinone biosynthesis C-methylase UbiE